MKGCRYTDGRPFSVGKSTSTAGTQDGGQSSWTCFYLCVKRANKIRNFYTNSVHCKRCGPTVSLWQHCFLFISGARFFLACISVFSRKQFNVDEARLQFGKCLLSVGSVRCLNHQNTGNSQVHVNLSYRNTLLTCIWKVPS
jgi:hypothetical protein